MDSASLVSKLMLLELPLVETILVAGLCGVVGVLAILRRRVFFTQALTHATFPGAIIGVVLVGAGVFGAELANNPRALTLAIFIGATLACIPMAWGMGRLQKVPGQSPEAVSGVLLTFGFALGYFLAKWFAPLPLKVASFLTGKLLNVNGMDIIWSGSALVVAALVAFTMGRQIVAACFDEVGFQARGGNLWLVDAAIYLLIGVTVVVCLPAVGSVLAIGLIAGPAAGMARLIPEARTLLWVAPIWAIICALIGLMLGVVMNLSTGGMIAILSAIGYLLPAGISWIKTRRGLARI
ncbi:metal ABC transporter permease [Boudabousia marimammalium]|uniref:Zinc ABC transporter permease n=1 Tax=Boudabousia marimammalium TaxID=156892 RepID=A0A1Q5PM80_9ACTO|nr:metal ABC transporter permease [Boudabousia marimammalium]OKL48632.1 hypothetical protein BM477_05350 [Boudabousia marimammalium]